MKDSYVKPVKEPLVSNVMCEGGVAVQAEEPQKQGFFGENTWEVQDTLNFVRKVYIILAIQLSITTGFIFLAMSGQVSATRLSNGILLVQVAPGSFTAFLYANNLAIGITCAVLMLVFMIMILCTPLGRTAGINFVLLTLFTCSMSFMLAGFTSRFPAKIVCAAILCTALVTISLTIYACTAKDGIAVMMGLVFVLIFAFIPIWFIGIFGLGLSALHTSFCAFGLLLWSVYLIIDTMIICGKEKHNGIAFDYNDYVIGAMILYIDIIYIFIYMLRMMGNR